MLQRDRSQLRETRKKNKIFKSYLFNKTKNTKHNISLFVFSVVQWKKRLEELLSRWIFSPLQQNTIVSTIFIDSKNNNNNQHLEGIYKAQTTTRKGKTTKIKM